MDRALEILPSRHQPALPLERLIVAAPPSAEMAPMDVVIVGAGPAGLCAAIELARLCKADPALAETQIGVLEKAGALGGHTLSGAVINPVVLREMFPDVPEDQLPFRGRVEGEAVYCLSASGKVRIPTPPTMRNHANRVASLCEVVRWLGGKAEELGVSILPGYAAASLLADGDKVVGVRTATSGLKRDGAEGPNYTPPTDLGAKFVVLGEGTRGALSQAYMQWRNVASANPQIFALGVKELWELKRPVRDVVHTMGWPLPNDAFGGSFMYPMGGNLAAIGLVVGLDYRDSALDVHELLQRLKTHPLFRPVLEGGTMLEWGAKTIPEGGYWSVPERPGGPGLLICGDAAGLVEVASLKGVHYAMQSGVFAARAIFEALRAGDAGADVSAPYRAMIDASFIRRDLHERRNLRLAFKSGFYTGAAKAGIMTLSRGRLLGGRIRGEADAAVGKRVRRGASARAFTPDGKLTFSKLDGVGRADNTTRDDIPSHLVVGEGVTPEVAEFYRAMCPAGVYEVRDGALLVNPPNCVDCKATDVLGPRWTAREGASGPNYKQM